MKKKFLVVAAIMLAALISNNVKAALVESTAITTTLDKPSPDLITANSIIARVNEIKAMDKTNLNKAEKKSLKKELRSLKTQLKDIGGHGVYLSLGAIIIIILLLILIL